MKTILFALALLIGCGTNSPSETTLDGTWVDVANPDAVAVLKFSGSSFEYRTLATLTDGTVGVQIDSGTFATNDSSLVMTAQASSCSGVQSVSKTRAATFARNGNSLQLTSGTTALYFQLGTAPTGMGAATVGCFSTTGAFTPHAVAAIP